MRLFFIKEFLDLIFPLNCVLCSRNLNDYEECMCTICTGLLPVTTYHLRPTDNDLSDKIKGLTNARMVLSYLKFTKKGKSQKLLHQLKYRSKPELANQLGKNYGTLLSSLKAQAGWDMIVPVPLHPLKQKRRGYNQSEEFGKGLSEKLAIPLYNSLSRSKFTSTQTNKSRFQRMENVDSVFEFNNVYPIQNTSIVLVDDVMTTGATLCECANVLLKNGAKNVDLITIAAGG